MISRKHSHPLVERRSRAFFFEFYVLDLLLLFNFFSLSLALLFLSEDVAPGQKVAVKLSFSPVRTGVRRLLVDFDSNRLKDVKGYATVVVRKKFSPLITAFN